jgi:hypothetical protein
MTIVHVGKIARDALRRCGIPAVLRRFSAEIQQWDAERAVAVGKASSGVRPLINVTCVTRLRDRSIDQDRSLRNRDLQKRECWHAGFTLRRLTLLPARTGDGDYWLDGGENMGSANFISVIGPYFRNPSRMAFALPMTTIVTASLFGNTFAMTFLASSAETASSAAA